jgi:predicted TPR repeat methyltransferase
MAAAVKRFVAKGGLDILDLGCGTGLAGEHLVSLKGKMTGVDLSPKMLEKAKQRGIYDELIQGELIQFLDAQKATFDVVVCADVFIYIGDLTPVFRGVRRALREDGLFCFSLEASADSDVVVRESFRFAHSAAYIERLARENQFAVEEMTPTVIRQDKEATIEGYLVALRRAG